MSLRKSPEAGEHPPEQSKKRRKVAQACEKCRERKIRCDGVKPRCGTCQNRQQWNQDMSPCVYNDVPRAATEREYIEILHNRIHQLKHVTGQAQIVTPESATSKSDNSFIEIESDPMGAHGQCSILVPASYLEPYGSALEGSQVASRDDNGPVDRITSSTSENRYGVSERSDSRPPVRSPINIQSDSPPNNGRLGTELNHAKLRNPQSSATTSEIRHFEQPTVWSNANLAIHEEASPKMSADGQIVGSESVISAMGAAATTEDDTPRSLPGFYGASSAISFFNVIQAELKNDCPSLDMQPLSRPTPKSSQSAQSPVKLLDFGPRARLQDFHLPPRVLADYLVETYWDNVHCLYPLIHKSSFEAVYRQLWTSAEDAGPPRTDLDIGLGSSSCPTSIFYCALNAIFALGCNFSILPSAQKRDLADTFCQRSLDLALGNLLDNSNLALVQALFILGQYLQSTDSPTRCWNVVGLALRVAQGIGLYVDRAYANSSLLETEMKRRTWHACLLLDVITGITLGRPTLPAREASVPLPAAVDDIYLESAAATNVQPEEIFSQNAFFVQTLKLYNIFGEVLTHFYKPWQDLNRDHQQLDKGLQNNVLSFVVDVESDLSDFKSNLPLQLQWDCIDTDNEQSWILERQQNILYTRFLHLKVLLYRPIFHQLYLQQRRNAALKLSNHDKTVMTIVIQRCSRACVENAQDLISHIHRTSQTKATGAWWYAIFYMFTSGMILILARTNHETENPIPQDSIEASWRKCMATLDRLAVEHITARKCAATLEKLHEQAMAAQNVTQPLSSNEAASSNAAKLADDGATQHARAVIATDSETVVQAQDAWHSFDPLLLQDVLWQQPNGQLPWDVVDENWWQSMFDNS